MLVGQTASVSWFHFLQLEEGFFVEVSWFKKILSNGELLIVLRRQVTLERVQKSGNDQPNYWPRSTVRTPQQWRIFGRKRQKDTRAWRKLQGKIFGSLYCSQNVVWMINSKNTRWERLVWRIVHAGNEKRVKNLVDKPGRRNRQVGRPRSRF